MTDSEAELAVMRKVGAVVRASRTQPPLDAFYPVEVVNAAGNSVTVREAAHPSLIPAELTLYWHNEDSPDGTRFQWQHPASHTLFELYPADHPEAVQAAFDDAAAIIFDHAVELADLNTALTSADLTPVLQAIRDAVDTVELLAAQARSTNNRGTSTTAEPNSNRTKGVSHGA